MEQMHRAAMKAIALGLLGFSLMGCDGEPRGDDDGAEVTLTEGYNGPLVRDLSGDEFDDFTRIGGRLVVVEFHAEWWGPCRQLGPVMEKLTNELEGTVVLGKVDIDEERALSSRLGVGGIPDVRIYLNGKEVERFLGAMPESEVRELFARHAPLKVMVNSEGAAPGGGAGQGEPAVQPMSKDWLPPGMQRK